MILDYYAGQDDYSVIFLLSSENYACCFSCSTDFEFGYILVIIFTIMWGYVNIYLPDIKQSGFIGLEIDDIGIDSVEQYILFNSIQEIWYCSSFHKKLFKVKLLVSHTHFRIICNKF